jgi:sensor c-di-GMP phosphodiesterase-like protein
MLILLALIVAASPLLIMRWVVNAHAAAQAQTMLDNLSRRILQHAESTVAEAADALASVAPRLNDSCGPDVRERLSTAVAETTNVRSMFALAADGSIRCASSEIPLHALPNITYRPARHGPLAIGVDKTVDTGRATLYLRWSDGERVLVAVLAPDVHRLDIVPTDWQETAIGLLSFHDGTIAASIPARQSFAGNGSALGGRLFTAETVSESLPLRAAMSLPYETIWASRCSLGLFVEVAGGIMGVAFFALVLNAARRPRTVEDALQRGLRRDEFVPFYQPVFNIQSGKLVGCEVLIRWRRKDGQMIPPGAFIQQAEESGIAVEMTSQLMRKVRDEVAPYYAERPHLKLAFNLFADHFSDLSTEDDIRETFRTGGIRYTQLVFEVTERYPLPNLNRAKVAISGLQSLGCRVALDDAGTGHGGLAYLQKLGMDQIKIDKLFVDTITASSASSPIVDSLIALGRSLGMEIVAEGVETTEQLTYLKSRGVDCAQGFLFAKPLPGAAYIKLVESLLPARHAAVAEADDLDDAIRRAA